jgi:LuxR family maltose regulon positive regulatory protein
MSRTRIAAALDAGAEKPLTILAAPAGAGKSAALSSWAAARAAPVAWVSLDEADSDRRRFWNLVLVALRNAGGPDPVAGLQVNPGESMEILIPEFINALEAFGRPVVLVLDDLHRSSTPDIYADLERVLRHPSSNLRLVISTRVDPHIGIERLRLGGDVVELRAKDLAFTLEETADLFELLQIRIAQEDTALIWRRAEGWAAGLRLAATTLLNRPDHERVMAELAGDNVNVAEYLLAEVLSREGPEIREFLIRASIPEELPVELAMELTGRDDSWPLMDELTHRHAFLSPVGDRRGVYRLHTLFAELLRAQLKYERPGEVPVLHARAARWYARNGDSVSALRHAVESGNKELAAELARACWVRALAIGEFSFLKSLVERARGAQSDGDPEFALALAASLIEGEDDGLVDHYLAIADEGAGTLSDKRRDEFCLARAAVMLYRGRAQGDLVMAQEAAERLLSDSNRLHASEDHEAIRALALSTLGIVEIWNGDPEAARRHLERGLAISGVAGLDWIRLLCSAYLALGSLTAGRLAAAEQRAHSTLELAAKRGWNRSTPAAVALTVLAYVQFHWSDIEAAQKTLDRAVLSIRQTREPPLLALYGLCRGRILAAQGRFGEALEALDVGLDRLVGWGPGAELRSGLETEAAIVRAALGQREIAKHDLEQAPPGSRGPTIALARLALAEGNAEEARSLLTEAIDAEGQMEIDQRVEMWVLSAIADDALADHDGAHRSLEQALELAEPGGFRHELVAQGTTLRPALRRQLRLGTGHRAFVDELLEALDDVDGRGSNRPVLSEQLTDREAAVLRFLPTRMPNQQIASEMFVSVNTVKTHLRSIYRKLDATDRQEAVKRARELALLAPSLAKRS